MISNDWFVTDISIKGLAFCQCVAIFILILNRIGYLIAFDAVCYDIICITVHVKCRCCQSFCIVTTAETDTFYIIFFICHLNLAQIKRNIIACIQILHFDLLLTADAALISCG